MKSSSANRRFSFSIISMSFSRMKPRSPTRTSFSPRKSWVSVSVFSSWFVGTVFFRFLAAKELFLRVQKIHRQVIFVAIARDVTSIHRQFTEEMPLFSSQILAIEPLNSVRCTFSLLSTLSIDANVLDRTNVDCRRCASTETSNHRRSTSSADDYQSDRIVRHQRSSNIDRQRSVASLDELRWVICSLRSLCQCARCRGSNVVASGFWLCIRRIQTDQRQIARRRSEENTTHDHSVVGHRRNGNDQTRTDPNCAMEIRGACAPFHSQYILFSFI